MAVIASVVVLAETNGAGPTGTTTNGIAAIGFGGIDAPNLTSAQSPIVVLSGGVFSVSFKKWIRAYVTWPIPGGGNTNTHTVSAFRIYCSSNPGNGYLTGTSSGAPFWGIQSSMSWVQFANGSGGGNYANNWIPYQTPDQVSGFSIAGTSSNGATTFTSNGHAGQGYIPGSVGGDGSNPSVTVGGLDAGTIYSPTNTGTLAAPNYSNYFMLQMTCSSSAITPPGTLSLSGSGGAPVIAYQWSES